MAEDTTKCTVLHELPQVAASLLGRARESAEATVEEGDAEALHRYRVALRKLRSVLKELRAVLDASQSRELRRMLGAMSARTNTLRDLDVMLGCCAAYRTMLPTAVVGGLDLIVTDFRHRRGVELQSVRRWMRSELYRKQFDACCSRFSSSDIYADKPQVASIGRTVAEAVSRSYYHIRQRSKNLAPDTPAEELHKLRINCKRLRYLLELFGQHFLTTADLKPCIKVVKRAQTALGEFNDLRAQQQLIASYLEDPSIDVLRAAAAGALMTTLHGRQKQARERVLHHCRELSRLDCQSEFSRYRGLAC